MIRLGVGLALKNEDPEEMARAYVDAGYSADSYLALLKAVDRPALAVHLDPVNWINSPARYYDNAALVRDCFRKLGPWIVSCHARDIVLRETLTVHLDEVAPTQGALDYGVYLQELARLPGDMPLLLEHLPQGAFPAARRAIVHAAAQAEVPLYRPSANNRTHKSGANYER